MMRISCPICGGSCVRNGTNKSGSQRWLCRSCSLTFTPKIDNSSKQLAIFLKWLFGKETQKNMRGEGRTFRRKTARFWDIWPMPPIVESKQDVLFLDGIYLSRKACILVCCNEKHVLGWYLCRYEHSGAWISLMSRIAEPVVVVSDGGKGFAKALKKAWPNAQHQRCLFHIFCQIKRYTTSRPNTAAGIVLYSLAKDLLHIKNHDEAERWTDRFIGWMNKYSDFLSEITYDEHGKGRPKHERLIKALNSLVRLIREGTMFTYLDDKLVSELGSIPATNNQVEGGINSRLRAMLREHRGLSIERRIKAVFWWCYMHSPEPLTNSEILDCMPTDKSINDIYLKMTKRDRIQNSVPGWGDSVVWSELHHSSKYPVYWD